MYDLRVLVKNKPIKKYPDNRGNNWIEARENTKFTLKVNNSTWNKVLAVVSVDGLNVINGKHENPATAPGYIVSPHNSTTISGWRLDNEKVRKFVFSNIEKSYAKVTGNSPSNIGVIGVSIYEEQPQYNWIYYYPYDRWYYPSYYDWDSGSSYMENRGSTAAALGNRGSTTAAFCAYSASEPSSTAPAVGSGKKIDSYVQNTNFGTRLWRATIVLYYDNLEGLKKRGIVTTDSNRLPVPFPDSGHCTDIRTT